MDEIKKNNAKETTSVSGWDKVIETNTPVLTRQEQTQNTGEISSRERLDSIKTTIEQQPGQEIESPLGVSTDNDTKIEHVTEPDTANIQNTTVQRNVAHAVEKKNPLKEVSNVQQPKPIIKKERSFTNDDLSKLIAQKLNLDNMVIKNPIDDKAKQILSRVKETKIKYMTKTKKIVLFNSGYVVDVRPITFAEKLTIKSARSESEHHQKEILYKIIWDAIVNSNIVGYKNGKPSFEDWLKITSFLDEPMLVHGLIVNSIVDKLPITVTCNSIVEKDDPDNKGQKIKQVCGNETEMSLKVDELLQIKNDETYDKFRELLYSEKDTVKLLKDSPMAQTEKILLTDGVVSEIRIPSLQDRLEILSVATDEQYADYAHILQIAMMTKNILYPNIELLKNTGDLEFIADTNIEEIYNYYHNITSTTDIDKIDVAIEEFSNKYDVHIGTPEIKCGSCGEVIGNRWINVLGLLDGVIDETF